MNDKFEELQSNVFNAVLDDGHLVQYIGPTPARVAPRAYTVGRSMRGQPEILVTGLDKGEAHKLLDELASTDVTVDSTVMFGELMITFIEAEPLAAVGAVAAFGEVTVLQAVWHDVTETKVNLQPLMTPGSIPLGPTTDPYGDDE